MGLKISFPSLAMFLVIFLEEVGDNREPDRTCASISPSLLKKQFLALKRKWRLANIILAVPAKAQEPNPAIPPKLAEPVEELDRLSVRKDFSASSLPARIAGVPDKLSPIPAPSVMAMGEYLKTKLFPLVSPQA